MPLSTIVFVLHFLFLTLELQKQKRVRKSIFTIVRHFSFIFPRHLELSQGIIQLARVILRQVRWVGLEFFLFFEIFDAWRILFLRVRINEAIQVIVLKSDKFFVFANRGALVRLLTPMRRAASFLHTKIQF